MMGKNAGRRCESPRSSRKNIITHGGEILRATRTLVNIYDNNFDYSIKAWYFMCSLYVVLTGPSSSKTPMMKSSSFKPPEHSGVCISENSS